MLPDVIQDHVTDAAKRLGVQYTESVFYKCALDNGFGAKAEEQARELDIIWKRKGYAALPTWVKDFMLRVTGTVRQLKR